MNRDTDSETTPERFPSSKHLSDHSFYLDLYHITLLLSLHHLWCSFSFAERRVSLEQFFGVAPQVLLSSPFYLLQAIWDQLVWRKVDVNSTEAYPMVATIILLINHSISLLYKTS